MADCLVKLENLSTGYDNKLILNKVNLEVRAGDFIAIIGPNGCGKSTLLKSILGLNPIQSGTREVLGYKNPSTDKTAGQIAYIPQRLKLNSQIPLSVEEFLSLKLNKKIPQAKIDEALKNVDLLDFKKESIHQLSGGQMQRIFFAYTLLNEPKLICLDEATEGMDSKSESQFFKMLKQDLESRNSALIMISHDIAAVTEQANRVICIKEGEFHETRPQDPNFHSCLHKIYGEDKFIHDHKHDH